MLQPQNEYSVERTALLAVLKAQETVKRNNKMVVDLKKDFVELDSEYDPEIDNLDMPEVVEDRLCNDSYRIKTRSRLHKFFHGMFQ